MSFKESVGKFATGIWNNMDAHSGKYLGGGMALGAAAGAGAGFSGQDGGIAISIGGAALGAIGGGALAAGAFRGLGRMKGMGIKADDAVT